MTPPSTDAHPAIGGVLRFHGHDYRIVGHPDDPRFTEFARDDALDPLAVEKHGACNTADLRLAEEGWWYLPQRVAPALGVDTGLPIERRRQLVVPEHVKQAIRAREEYAQGRDDLAIAAVADVFRLEYPLHASDPEFMRVHYAPGEAEYRAKLKERRDAIRPAFPTADDQSQEN